MSMAQSNFEDFAYRIIFGTAIAFTVYGLGYFCFNLYTQNFAEFRSTWTEFAFHYSTTLLPILIIQSYFSFASRKSLLLIPLFIVLANTFSNHFSYSGGRSLKPILPLINFWPIFLLALTVVNGIACHLAIRWLMEQKINRKPHKAL